MDILEKITSKELTPIGWGIGLMFNKRTGIHDFNVAFTIHTNPDKKSIKGTPVLPPKILETIDRRKHILIAYTIDYLDFIYDHCKKYDDLLVLPFNDHRLGVKKNLRKINKNNYPFQNWGVLFENFREIEDV